MGAKSKTTKEKFTIAVDKEVLDQFRQNCKSNALSQSGKIEQLMINFNKSMTPQAKESKQVAKIVKKISALLDKKLNTLTFNQETRLPGRVPRMQELQEKTRKASIPKHAMQRRTKQSESNDLESQFKQRIASGHVPSISELTNLAHHRRKNRGF